jgi:hypothetical protein
MIGMAAIIYVVMARVPTKHEPPIRETVAASVPRELRTYRSDGQTIFENIWDEAYVKEDKYV